jgi:general secretion pathway protein K
VSVPAVSGACARPGRAPADGGERGFALLAVLLVMAMIGVLGAEFAHSMRLEASAVRAYRDTLIAAHLAEAAVEQATREVLGAGAFVTVADDGDLTFFTNDRRPVPRLPRRDVELGAGRFSYRLTDEESRINLNTAPPPRIDLLLQTFGLDKTERDVIGDSLQDWRDPNEEHRLNGAESDDHYLKREIPHRSKNRNLDSVAELGQIRGVTPALLRGREGMPGLLDVVTVRTPGQVNINTMGPRVARALGVADAEFALIQQARRAAPFTSVPGQFGGRGLTATTRTFRVEAEGSVNGQVRARLTAIIQRRTAADGDGIVVLEWSGVR